MSIKKLIFGLAAFALLLGVSVIPAKALTYDEQLAQLVKAVTDATNALTLLQGGTPATGSSAVCNFNRNLSEGVTGEDVTCLQNYLKSTGHFPAAINSTRFFGPTTKSSVMKWQTANDVAPVSGFFGLISQTKYYAMVGTTGPTGPGPITTLPTGCQAGWLVNPMTGASCTPAPLPTGCQAGDLFSRTVVGLSCTTPTTLPAGCQAGDLASRTTGLSCAGGTTPTTPTGLTGGAGSVSEYSLVSGITTEKVGEDENDQEVLGLDIEADEGSDLQFTAVKLVFDEGSAASDFDQFADDVSVWFNGAEVGRVAASGFTDDNLWTKTISLSDGAVIKAGKVGQLLVKVSGISNLDTGDATKTWTVDVRQIRFVDARGDSTSEDPTTNTRTFSFETYATAVNAELKIAEDSSMINTAHTIDVHASDDTADVSMLSFTMEAKGTSDLKIKKMAASTTVTGASNVDDLAKEITLWIGGEEIATGEAIEDSDGVSVGSVEDYLFDDVDYTIPAGTKVKAEIKVTFNSVADALDEGDTMKVEITEAETDTASMWDVRDESNTRLVDADLAGSATGEAHAVYDVAIQVAFVTSDSSEDELAGQLAGNDDTGTYTITFNVTAFGDDVYVDGDVDTATTTASSFGGGDGITWATTTNSSSVVNHDLSLASSTPREILEAVAGGSTTDDASDVTTAGALSFFIQEGETRRFKLTVDATPQIPAGVTVGVRILGINWDTDSGDIHDTLYNFNLDSFKTSTEVLNAS